MSTSASKFLFDCDFGAPSGGSAKTIAAVQEAETRGYARGVEDGRRQGAAEADAQLTAAIRRLAERAASRIGSRGCAARAVPASLRASALPKASASSSSRAW